MRFAKEKNTPFAGVHLQIKFILLIPFLIACKAKLETREAQIKQKSAIPKVGQPSITPAASPTTSTSKTQSAASTPSPTPSYSLSLTSDVPLVHVASVNTTAYAISAGPYLTTNSVVAPVAPSSNVYTPPSVTDIAAAPGPATSVVLDSSTSEVNAGLIDGTLPVTANISLTAAFPPDSTVGSQACNILAPFSAITCALTGFSITSAAFTTSSLTVNATSDSVTNPTLTASTLVKKLRVRVISDTNPGANDIGWGYLSGDQYNGFSRPDLNGKAFQILAVNNVGPDYKMFMSDKGRNLVQISNVNPGGNDNCSKETWLLGARIYFACGTTRNLFSSDGTDLQQHSNFASGISMWEKRDATVFNSTLYFKAYASAGNLKLFAFDGATLTQLPETRVGGDDNPDILGTFNGRLYFSASNAGGFSKLYSIAGTGDLRQHTDTNGAANDAPSPIYQFGSRIYFGSRDSTVGGRERLYSSDGNDLKRHTNNCATGSDLKSFWYGYYPPISCGGKMYYWGLTSACQEKVFELNPSTNVINQISDVAGPAASDNITFMWTSVPVCYNDTPYFELYDGTSYSVYKYNGSNLVKLLAGTSSQTNPILGVGYLFFSANDGTNDYLYSYNGTVLRRLGLGKLVDATSRTYILNGRLYFEADDGTGTFYIYSSNGIDLVKISDSVTYAAWMFQTWNNISGGVLYFLHRSPGVIEKWARICEDDGTASCVD